MRKIGLGFGTCMAIFFISCEYHVENEDLQGELCNSVVSYSNDIRPLVDNNACLVTMEMVRYPMRLI